MSGHCGRLRAQGAQGWGRSTSSIGEGRGENRETGIMGIDTNSEPDNQLDAQEHSREERAFTLYCQGMRVAEIAMTLAVSETTIRRWLHARLETLAQEERAERAEQLLRAIESQRSIASAAWRAYEQVRNADEPDRHEGARYLSIALA